jgi:hypothetical protein
MSTNNNTAELAISYLVPAYRHAQYRVKHLTARLEEDKKKYLSGTEDAINGWKKHGDLILAKIQEYADKNNMELTEILNSNTDN